MKAVRLLEYGGQSVLRDVPTPTIARTESICSTGHNQAIHHQGAKETYDDHLRNHRQHTSGPIL